MSISPAQTFNHTITRTGSYIKLEFPDGELEDHIFSATEIQFKGIDDTFYFFGKSDLLITLDFNLCTNITGTDINDFLNNLMFLADSAGLAIFASTDLYQQLDGVYGDDFLIKVISGVNANLDVGDNSRIVWELDSDFVFIPGNAQFQVSSSSASDTTVLLFIEYVTEDFIPQTTTVTLNGQTNVALSVSDTYQINSASIAGGAINVGDIYIHTNVSGQTLGVPNDLTETQAFIAAGVGVMRMVKFTSYAGHKTVVKSAIISAAVSSGGNTTVTSSNFLRGVNNINLEVSKTHISTGGAIAIATGAGSFPEKTTLYVEARTGTNNTSYSQIIIFYIVKDTFTEKLKARFPTC